MKLLHWRYSQLSQLIFFAGILAALAVRISASEETPAVGADEALNRLKDGNARFVTGNRKPFDAAQLLKRRTDLAKEQKPFAIVVSCSDSRVPPEMVFDQGLGDRFVIRTAGEVIDPVAIGSIEYAVAHVGVSLVVVLGHQRCGAVSAAVSGEDQPGHISDIVKAIKPAVEQVNGKSGDAVDNAIHAQALAVVRQLQTSGPLISERAQSGKLLIVPAYYSLDSGKVEFLKP